MHSLPQDDTPELTESFSVVLTDVELVNEADRMGSPSNSPRIATNQESTVINILENDDSRGTLHVVTTVSKKIKYNEIFDQ